MQNNTGTASSATGIVSNTGTASSATGIISNGAGTVSCAVPIVILL